MKKLVLLFAVLIFGFELSVAQITPDPPNDRVVFFEDCYQSSAEWITFGCSNFLRISEDGMDVCYKGKLVMGERGVIQSNFHIQTSGSIIYEGIKYPFKVVRNYIDVRPNEVIELHIDTGAGGTKGHIQFNAWISLTLLKDGTPVVDLFNLHAVCND